MLFHQVYRKAGRALVISAFVLPWIAADGDVVWRRPCRISALSFIED